MKKVLSVVLVFVMCFFLGGCGSKFETEDAMWKYLNGVWEGEWEGEYFLFIDKKFININNTQIENVINDYFKEFIERNGYEAFENLTVEEASSAVCKEIVKLKDDYSVDFKTGVIKFAGVDECTIKIDKKFEDTILVSNSSDNFKRCFSL